MGILMLLAPRKYAIFPYIFVASFIPVAQRLVIFSLDFFFLRIITVFAIVRVLMRQEMRGLKFGAMDKLVVVYNLVRLIVITLQYQDSGPIIQTLGSIFDVGGMYTFFRCMIRTFDDLKAAVAALTLISIPTSVFFVMEQFTGRNFFSFMGGVPPFTEVREGKLRCQGAFGHPIIAGVFWGVFLPLIASQWFDPKKSKVFTLVGIVCCGTIVVSTNSSTSIMAILLAIVGACFYPLRKRMKSVRWAILAFLILIQLTMNGGIIYLLARINIFGGSTGWFRSYLMDRWIVYFFEWWLLGTRDTAHWAAGQLGGVGLADVSNHYVLESVRGGLATLLLFIWLIVKAFSNVGKMMATQEVSRDISKASLTWALGIFLFINVITFISVSYFQQGTLVIWFIFATCTSLADTVLQTDRRNRMAAAANVNRDRYR